MPVTIPHWLIPETATLVLDAANPLLRPIEELLFNGPKPQELTTESARLTRLATAIACIAARVLLVRRNVLNQNTPVFTAEGMALSNISGKLIEMSSIGTVAPMANEFTQLGHLVLDWRKASKIYNETSAVMALISRFGKSVIRSNNHLPVPTGLMTMDLTIQQAKKIKEIGEQLKQMLTRREAA